MSAATVLLGLALLVFLIWWLIIETEGVYLGRRVVVALYDLYAERYDRIKQFDQRADLVLLSEPLLQRIHPHNDPLILDVATGTGRLPLVLASNGRFEGHVVGIDLSRKMLDVAAKKIASAHFDDFITLLHQDAMNLPFPDACFDVVTCLEALEFLPDPRFALQEMVRVLREGGLLLTTIRIDTRWMPNRTHNESGMRMLLSSLEMAEIEVETWQADYSKVWARTPGCSAAASAVRRDAVLLGLAEITIKSDAQLC